MPRGCQAEVLDGRGVRPYPIFRRRNLLAITTLFACLFFAKSLAGPSAAAGQSPVCNRENASPLTAAILEDGLHTDGEFLRDCAIVTGDVDLRGITTAGPFVLTNSWIEGNLLASFANLRGRTDFTNTSFGEDFDVHGATFGSDAHWANATFSGVLNASGARFEQPLDLGNATASHAIVFDRAVFRAGGFFEGMQVSEAANFERASFDGTARFARAQFFGEPIFDDLAAGGDVDFSYSSFKDAPNFSGASVGNTMDFTEGSFDSGLTLDAVSAAKLVLRDTHMNSTTRPNLAMSDVDAGALTMDLYLIDRLPSNPERERVLQRIEDSARHGGDTATANDAEFRRQSIINQDRPWIEQAVVWLFGQQIFGFFVRPLRPLLAMFALACLGLVIRLGLHLSETRPTRSAMPRKTWLLKLISILFMDTGHSLLVAFSPKPPKLSGELDSPDDIEPLARGGARWLEWLSQKTLNWAFIIGLGNAFPGVKEIIDGVLHF